ncbi:ATP-binding cassette, sub-B (MDR TAP), member 4 [Entophlyctis luteolus]|nr:ATP-binding cassette, sub-B (MDR TAP), member 4 [Entophlyctis luteolus]
MQSLITYPYTQDSAKLHSDVVRGVIYLVIIGSVVVVAAYLQMAMWIWSGERQAKRIREAYFQAVLRQDMAWFDKMQTGDITTRMTADIALIQDGISDKVAQIIQSAVAFLSGFIIAFSKGWKLALVLCTAFPLLATAVKLGAKHLSQRKAVCADAYAAAGAIAQEALSSVRTVTSFGGQSREVKRYTEKLRDAEKGGIRAAIAHGVSTGAAFMMIFAMYALGFWYGGRLVPTEMTGGAVVTVFFSMIFGAIELGYSGTCFAAVSTAMGVAGKIFMTIDRESAIDPFSVNGKRPFACAGEIVFSNIDFSYPQRPEVPILKGFSLRVRPGSTIALVVKSGSGKSTVLNLLERWYDPVEGKITVDGIDLRDLNVGWLRQQIGIVGQEPVLFSRSIRENVLFGMSENTPDAYSRGQVDTMIERACRAANAWEFIQELPQGIGTNVGEAGSMLSGGQKQRIAIARAVMREPKILLLDEATSALDTTSEKAVQTALDSAAKNRTTIFIAHRLSTIKNADHIVVMDDGKIVEQGTHVELLDCKGVYAKLVAAQKLLAAEDEKFSSGSPISSNDEIPGDMARESSEFLLADRLPYSGKQPDAISIKITENQGFPKLLKKTVKNQMERNEQQKSNVPLIRMFKMSANEWWILALGSLMSAGNGIIFPMFSLVFTGILIAFGKENDEERNTDIRFYSIMLLISALSVFVVHAGSIICFGIAGERLTLKLRSQTFAALLRQEMGFFDDDKCNTGILISNLSQDASQVQGMVGQTISVAVQIAATVVTGFTIAFADGWQLALVVLCTFPLMAIAGKIQVRILSGYGSTTRQAYEGFNIQKNIASLLVEFIEASYVCNEAIDQIHTVSSLTKERVFLDKYKEALSMPHEVGVKGGFTASIGFAVGQAVIFFSYGTALYAGSEFAINGMMEVTNVLKVMFALIFTAVAAGRASTLAPDIVKSKVSAINIFEILDRTSRIDPTSQEGHNVEHKKSPGEAEVEDARPSVPVLQGMSIHASPGQTVALVGPSGCGKSTVIGILLRWYDLLSGRAAYDNCNIRDWNITNLRSHIALVSQEPVLFNMSIRDNIAYGVADGNTSQADIEEAARRANIAEFITGLPNGYDTVIGSKGGQISGGQKQRIAIARALIRDPKLLLLDEATSALDSESERVVQTALDAAAHGRTTIVIAHRLSTIQNSDYIIVANEGKVVEQGSFDELLKLNGLFADLVASQSLSQNEI